MENRCWIMWSSVIALVVFQSILHSECAPAFKLKHYNFYKSKEMSPPRMDKRLIGGSSPIHFISPFVPMPEPVVNPFANFISASASAPQSTIYKLPLRLKANGKLHSIIHGFPNKRHQFIDQFAQAASNIIQLPLKYMSNAKPIGIYFKDPSMNFL
ncbi:uncharacterized protein [Parasteatoda tepidariorum]|uniref:uncharacterized protein n=1 Tax=Parasteatoda tepidariorum TaxID=114398 RepID=UPI00077F9D6C|nr:uncharacterized protein LOC107450647 [Parasteatoda tepidariorum]